MIEKTTSTHWVKLYLSGPIDIAKQVIRAECLSDGLCVTIEPTHFVYTGGEESGYVVGLINYPRFPVDPTSLEQRAHDLMLKLLDGTYQHSALMMTPTVTKWISKRNHDLSQ